MLDLDAHHLKILAALQENGRLANNELADRSGCRPRPAGAG